VPPFKNFREINTLALFYGVGAFVLLYWFSSIGLSKLINWWFYPHIPEELLISFANSPWFQLFGLLLYLIPGFISGYIAHKASITHGLIVGTFTVPIIALFVFAGGFASAVTFATFSNGLALGLFWCSLAAWVGGRIATWRRRL